MSKLTIYQKPTCTTCRQTMAILKEAGVDFEEVNYYIDPIPKKRLKELIAKIEITPRELLRTKEPVYKELNLAGKKASDAELIDLMAKHPDLIQRPIVENGSKAILARPAEKIREIL
ncbi:MAG: arsenate reductase (glutaredoxin) [Bacteroidetes bacterium]|nr:arsenate reductase (glutaredoxin) [Bacteroidota bacterium]MCW5896911.1 arsenate reductase (glutaredoxin) [Bacteroidota bacterium]